MAATENDRPPNGYAKEWNRRFLEDQDFKEDGSFVELRKLVDADGDDLDVFLREYEGPVPDCAVALIKEFCSSINPNLLQTESTQTQRGAWLDDRDSHGGFRTYLNPIGPKELYGHLKQLRFECPGACDAARRLIYISNLNPYYILALAKTASEYQVSVLKDTIWKHLTLQASVRVEIPRGFPIFRLECHIPYLALRTSTMPSTESILAGVETKPRRKWFDLSFLKTSHPKELEKQRIGVYEAQISVVTCGSDKSKWATYAFVDTEFDGEPLEEGDFDYEGMHEDPIVSESDGQINANHPIQDAREYFLLVVEKRMAQVHREWKYLVQKVEESIEKFRDRQSATLSSRFGTARDRAGTVEEAYAYIFESIELLINFQDRLTKTLQAWKSFNSPEGDRLYFSDMLHGSAQQSLHSIKETLESLDKIGNTLNRLHKLCSKHMKVLQHRLNFETYFVNLESNKLSRESNHLNLETQTLSRESNTVSLRSNEIARRSNEIARRSNEIALRSGITAEVTLSIISPAAIVLACFGIQPDAMPFERSPRSLAVAFLIISLVMRVFFQLFDLGRRRPWWGKFFEWIGLRRPRDKGFGNDFELPRISSLPPNA